MFKFRSADNLRRRIVYKNTLMLYLLRASSYVFSFITIPYQTRVLGPELYGKVGIATAIMVYFQLMIDFGFLISGTQEIALLAVDQVKNHAKINEVYSRVQLGKYLMISISFGLLWLLCDLVPAYGQDRGFLFWFLLSTAFNALVPDFVYRGIQQMAAVTMRVIIARLIFTVLLVVFLRSPEDYYLLPILMTIGNLIALLWSVLYLYKTYRICLRRVSVRAIWRTMRTSGSFFLSCIASTVYSSLNLIIVSSIAPGMRGYYSVADKLLTSGQKSLTPISDSIYPYMSQNKDFKLIKKVLIYLMPVIIVGCGITFVFAEKISELIFGVAFRPAGSILRALMPAAIFTLPDYLLGFPTMTAIGITKHANYSIYVSSCLHVVAMLALYLTGHLSPVSLAWLVSFSLGVDLLYRAITVRYFWYKLNTPRMNLSQ